MSSIFKKISPKTFGLYCVSQKNAGHNHTSVETFRPANTEICPTPFQSFCLSLVEEELQQPGLSEEYDDHSSRTMCIRQSWNNSDLGISATETTDGVSPSIFLNARNHVIQNSNVAS
jgi:hypothetical protein